MEQTSTIIVGAGPIGLELAVVLKHLGHDYLHLEAGQIGQTISWYPRDVRFFSSPDRIAIAGIPLNTPRQEKASREEYLAYLRGVVDHYDLPVRTHERVVQLDRREDGFHVRTQRHGRNYGEYQCQHVVLAIGDMHKARLLGIPGEDLPHVSHYFDEPHRYYRQELLIVGGKNSAVEAAIRCCRAGARVTVSYRGPGFDKDVIKYWLYPEIQSLINAGAIRFLPNSCPVEITPTHVRLDGEPGNVAADFVLLLTGYVMDPQLLTMAGAELETENRSPKLDPGTMQTTVPGLYVAGTAAAGTQHNFRLFIENSHPHVEKICQAITGHAPPPGLVNDVATKYNLRES